MEISCSRFSLFKGLPEKTWTGSTSSAQPACPRSASELTLKVATMFLKQGQPGPDQVNFVSGSGSSEEVSRNFEALKRAEEQLEREDIARKEVTC